VRLGPLFLRALSQTERRPIPVLQIPPVFYPHQPPTLGVLCLFDSFVSGRGQLLFPNFTDPIPLGLLPPLFSFNLFRFAPVLSLFFLPKLGCFFPPMRNHNSPQPLVMNKGLSLNSSFLFAWRTASPRPRPRRVSCGIMPTGNLLFSNRLCFFSPQP